MTNERVAFETDRVPDMKQLNATFAALADPTRRALLEQLVAGEATLSELAAPFKMTLPAVLHHLKVLEAAALIERNKHGYRTRIRLRLEAMASARDWFDIRERVDHRRRLLPQRN